MKVTCEACQGSGEIVSLPTGDIRCPSCGGSGVLSVRQQEDIQWEIGYRDGGDDAVNRTTCERRTSTTSTAYERGYAAGYETAQESEAGR